MKLHREGFGIITWTILFLVGLNILVHLTISIAWIFWTVLALSLIFLVLVLQFFRNPSRTIAIDANAIIAPADGKIVVIEETTEDEYFGDRRIQISIFMSPLNVHLNRNPIGGVIDFVKYHPGKYLVAWHPKSSTENERTTVVIDNGTHKILFRQIAGAVARRIKYYVSKGDKVEQGSEMGFIKFGSRVDVFLPLNVNVKVSAGQISLGGVTVLATFN